MAEINEEKSVRDEIGELWLQLMLAKVKDKSINATESAILARILIHSGWTLDPTRVPKGLREKLTEKLDLNDPVTAEELGIIPMKRRASGV